MMGMAGSRIIPQNLLSCREAIRLALDRLNQEQVDTCWMDAGDLLDPEYIVINKKVNIGQTLGLSKAGFTQEEIQEISEQGFADQVETDLLFGNFAPSVSGEKFNDLNGDGTPDADEPGLAG